MFDVNSSLTASGHSFARMHQQHKTRHMAGDRPPHLYSCSMACSEQQPRSHTSLKMDCTISVCVWQTLWAVSTCCHTIGLMIRTDTYKPANAHSRATMPTSPHTNQSNQSSEARCKQTAANNNIKQNRVQYAPELLWVCAQKCQTQCQTTCRWRHGWHGTCHRPAHMSALPPVPVQDKGQEHGVSAHV